MKILITSVTKNFDNDGQIIFEGTIDEAINGLKNGTIDYKQVIDENWSWFDDKMPDEFIINFNFLPEGVDCSIILYDYYYE